MLLGISLEGSRGGSFAVFWEPVGASWGPLGASWRRLGGDSGILGAILEWGLEKSVRVASLVPLLSRLRGLLGPSWGLLGHIVATFGASWSFWDALKIETVNVRTWYNNFRLFPKRCLHRDSYFPF